MTTGTSLTDRPRLGVRAIRRALAPRDEVARWVMVAAVVAAVLLGGVAVIAAQDPGRAAAGLTTGLLASHHSFGDALYVFRRNLLVLGIHLCACWIGAIVGRPHQPVPTRWGRIAGTLHRPVPAWMGRAAFLYALLVTLLSVVVQAIALGRLLADLSTATHVTRVDLLVLVLPHAVPELLAVFLPLGLFLLEARRGRLDRLGPWSLQAAAIALPVLLCAALIETYLTPPRVIAASHRAQASHAVAAAGPPGRRGPTLKSALDLPIGLGGGQRSRPAPARGAPRSGDPRHAA